jgi:hypothetical protein
MSTLLKHSATAVRTFPHIFYHSTHVPLLLKARLCLRSRVQTYATSSVVHKGKISRSRLLFFSPHYLTAL